VPHALRRLLIQFNSETHLPSFIASNQQGEIPVHGEHRLLLTNALIMLIHNIYGVWRIAFTLLALSTNGLISALHTSLTDHENDMMKNGTFVYSTLSAIKKAALFNDFQTTYSRKVVITRFQLY
jgi:hypothetical protein